jgi:hypothetical protein
MEENYQNVLSNSFTTLSTSISKLQVDWEVDALGMDTNNNLIFLIYTVLVYLSQSPLVYICLFLLFQLNPRIAEKGKIIKYRPGRKLT